MSISMSDMLPKHGLGRCSQEMIVRGMCEMYEIGSKDV